jgi:hypothetical protein
VPESLSTRLGGGQPPSRKDLQMLLTAVQADVAALRASIVLITAKLDLDAGVTDVNYASTCNPAALETLP